MWLTNLVILRGVSKLLGFLVASIIVTSLRISVVSAKFTNLLADSVLFASRIFDALRFILCDDCWFVMLFGFGFPNDVSL